MEQQIDIQKVSDLELMELYIQQRELLAQSQQNVIAIQAEVQRRKELVAVLPNDTD
jgi:hypothetical protein